VRQQSRLFARWNQSLRRRPNSNRLPLATAGAVIERVHMKLNIKAFALTCGIVWALSLFLLTWWLIAFGGSTGTPTLISKVYLGYTISPIGSVIGLVYAFVDALIGGAIFAWLYNKIVGKP
jgi:hypothetical protein